MSVACIYAAMIHGIHARKITIEIDISHGLHSFSIVGLGDRAVEEAKDRISAAIKNSGYTSPKQKNQKVVIALAPADIRKEGSAFDLAMAIGYLNASGDLFTEKQSTSSQYIARIEESLFIGELSLHGHICSVPELFSILYQAKKLGFVRAYIPQEDAHMSHIIRDIDIVVVHTLTDVISHIRGEYKAGTHISLSDSHVTHKSTERTDDIDMCDIRGNVQAKRGLEIAVAGWHNVVMYGPPGTGKTLLAKSTRSLIPNLDDDECMEVMNIYAIARIPYQYRTTRPPFRAPHHTISPSAMIGGGSIPKPGEVTLAHKGILFLDEFPEFGTHVIESLREPLEERRISIARAKHTVTFPAHCMLIASMNLCPCGKDESLCTCTPKSILRYKERVSGPISDRIDIWLNVHTVDYRRLADNTTQNESSSDIQKRIQKARKLQIDRYRLHTSHKTYNTEMDAHDIETVAMLSNTARTLLVSSAERMKLSARAYHRTIKVARTIADLDQSHEICEHHMLEALTYRRKD